MIRVAVITLSDSGYSGKRSDLSGPKIVSMVTGLGWTVTETKLLPDHREMLAAELRKICDSDCADLILTTGGTGFSPTDITPEATLDVVQRLTPGIPEAIRYYSMKITPLAMLSREVAGIRNKTLIVNLPGSPKAVEECFQAIIPALPHGLEVLTGAVQECARK